AYDVGDFVWGALQAWHDDLADKPQSATHFGVRSAQLLDDNVIDSARVPVACSEVFEQRTRRLLQTVENVAVGMHGQGGISQKRWQGTGVGRSRGLQDGLITDPRHRSYGTAQTAHWTIIEPQHGEQQAEALFGHRRLA